MNGRPVASGTRVHAFRWLVAGPTVWLAHFLASYLTAALWCVDAGVPAQSLGWVRVAVAVYTIVGLVGIGVVSVGAARWRSATDELGRFVGRTTLLLCGVSAVAILYVALTAVFVGTCR